MRDPKSPLAGFIPAFLATNPLAPKSITDYGRVLKEFDEFTGHIDLESALTMANAKAWQLKKRENGLNATINATMYLKSFATWACKSGYRCGPEEQSVLVHLKAPQGKKRVRHALTQQQLDEIWRALALPSTPGGNRGTALLRILLATGLKREKARTLLRNDFQPDANGWRGRILARMKPYTDVGATILRLDRITVAAVRDYLSVRPAYAAKPPEPLLLNKDRIGFTENGFGSWIRRIAEHIEAETGIPWTTEDMRFTSNVERHALIHDPDLREMCSATLEAPEGETEYEDAVADAGTLLEIRVRSACNPPREQRSGWKLMQFAFAEPNPGGADIDRT
jgi:site-specific recombinase XerD